MHKNKIKNLSCRDTQVSRSMQEKNFNKMNMALFLVYRLDYFLHIRSGRPPLLIPVANNIECGWLKRAYNYIIIIIIIIGLLITEKIIS